MTTLPRLIAPEGVILDPNDLAAGRYGTHEMVGIWGPEQTFKYSLRVLATASSAISWLYPAIVPLSASGEIERKASLKHIISARIRELEAKTGHDVIAITRSLEEVVDD